MDRLARRGDGDEMLAAKVELLSKVSFFCECSKRDLAKIARVTEEVRLPSGTVVVREGEPGDRFYVVAEGLTHAFIGRRKIASIGAGSFFGEMALLDQGPRTATVRTELPTRLLTLTADAFGTVVKENPPVALKIMRGLAERLRKAETSKP